MFFILGEAGSVTKRGISVVLRLVTLLVAVHRLVVQAQSGGLPDVSLVWPDPTVRVTETLQIKLKANAMSPTGSIAQVQFFAQTNLLGVATNPPFNLLWSVGSGLPMVYYDRLVLSAVAIDNAGLSATSAPVTVFLYGGPPPSPILNIVSPRDGALFAAPATFALSAELLASLGDTGPEEFFLGTNSLGVVNTNGANETFTAQTPPVSVTVSNLAKGSYNLAVHYLGFNGAYCFCSSTAIEVVDLAAVSPRIRSDGRFEFVVLTSFAGRPNVIEVSTNLANWTPIGTNMPSMTDFTFTDPSPVAGLTRFYRVLVTAQ